MTVILYLLAVALLILINAFFVALEFSLITCSRSLLRDKQEEGSAKAGYALAGVKKMPRYLAGSQLGITISTLALGFLAEPAIARLFDSVSFISHALAAVLAIILATFIQIVIGEIVPKNMALADPDRAVLLLARPHFLFVKIFNPIIWALDKITALGVRMLGVSYSGEEASRTPVELVGAVEESLGGGVIDRFDYNLLRGVLDLSEQTVGRNMVLRPRIASINPDSTATEIESIVLSSGHSRLPVIAENMKKAVGFVHSKDLLFLEESKRNERIAPELVRPVLSLPPDCPLDEALVLMQKERKHLAIVLDRRNNILGLITIEDVLESFAGEFPDD